MSPHTNSGRTAGAGLIVLAVIAGTAGCSSATSTEPNEKITLLNWDPIVEGSAMAQAITAFEESSGVDVEVLSAPTSDYDAKLLTMMSSGNPPDVIRISDDFIYGYSRDGLLYDLNPLIESSGVEASDYLDFPFDFPIQDDGSHTAWAVGMQPNVLFYNVDAFEAAGVPRPPSVWSDEDWTWDDFVETAEELTTDTTWGALLFDDSSTEVTVPVNNGGDGVYSEDGTAFALADPEGVGAVQWLADLSLVHGVQPPYSKLQAGMATPNYGPSMFTAGEVAMMSKNFGIASYIRDNADFEWDIAPLPANVRQNTISPLITWAIPQQASNPEEAWEFLQFLSSDEGAELLTSTGDFIPAARSAAEKFGQSSTGSPEHLALAVEAVEHSLPENLTPYTQQARAIYRPQLQLIYSGQTSAADGLEEIRDAVNQVLAGQ